VRKEIDPDPERADLFHNLEYLDVGADLVEAERRGQPADAGSDDEEAQAA
jgi:hypothetical protein